MVNLKDLYDTYERWLYINDTKRIDIALAVALTRKKESGTPVWLIIIGPSGDWKSLQISCLNDSKHSYLLRSLTKNTITTGYEKAKDLAPELNAKLLLIPEMAQILKLDTKERAQIWAQFRDLYDGIAGRVYGTGKRIDYKDLRVTCIMGSTPIIDRQLLIHQDLGTRELCWRTSPKDKIKKEKTMHKAWDNENNEKLMYEELNNITTEFLRDKKYKSDIYVPEEIKNKIFSYGLFLSKMRATAEIDQITGELLSDCSIEEPTRVIKQFKMLYLGLKSLDDNYTDERALQIIEHVVISSSFVNRIKVFLAIIENNCQTLSYYANKLRLGKKTVQREINILWNLDLIDCKEEESETKNRVKSLIRWHLTMSDESKEVAVNMRRYMTN